MPNDFCSGVFRLRKCVHDISTHTFYNLSQIYKANISENKSSLTVFSITLRMDTVVWPLCCSIFVVHVVEIEDKMRKSIDVGGSQVGVGGCRHQNNSILYIYLS